MDIQNIEVGDYIIPSRDREYMIVTANKLYKVTSVMRNADGKVYEVWFLNDNNKAMVVNASQFRNETGTKWKIQPGLNNDNPKYLKVFTALDEANAIVETIAIVDPLELIDIALDFKDEELFNKYWKLKFGEDE